MGWGNTTTDGFLYSRALIKDGNGDPTTITLLADEFLDVTYELRCYPNLTDVTITGLDLGESTHDVTIRAANVTSGTLWGFPLGGAASFSAYPSSTIFNGGIGVITSSPSGDSANLGEISLPYSANSRKQTASATLSLNYANLAGGIRSIKLSTSLGAHQLEFNPPINKTSEKTLTLNFEVSWGRHVA